jgi:tRNA dimethylallyltransferase
MRPVLIVVVGPTGSGKSDLAVHLAGRYRAPIISTDSRQVYRGMAIGTAQPTENQLAAVPHYFIADREPTERFTCGDFEREALALLEKLFETSPVVVAVGGSGLYIDALCGGLDPLPDVDPELRNELMNRLSREGLEPMLEQLRALDPDFYDTVDRKNPARVIRALEVCLSTGRPFSQQRSGPGARKTTPRPFEIIKIGIDLPRNELYARIERRVDSMMAAGLEAEARVLYPLRHLPALQTVGYSELFDHFDRLDMSPDAAQTPSEKGAHMSPAESLARAVELIKRNSRRYAKRQMTWFRRDPSIHWFGNPPSAL